MRPRQTETIVLLSMTLALLPWPTGPGLPVDTGFVTGAGLIAAQRQEPAAPVTFASPVLPAPLFFREEWRQSSPFDASTNYEPERPITQAAVTYPNLELHLYDPHAREIAGFLKTPPTDTRARDWGGPSCIQLGGYNQNPRPTQVVAGQPTDPPNLWTGACQGPVAATLRHKTKVVDLSGLARIRWVTRTSGLHVVRPLVKLANGTWLVGDYGEGLASSNSTLFLESEFAMANVRWLALDITRVVTRGTFVEKPDLTRVDEVGFADLMPGSGHGWGGFVNVGRIEVYGAGVTRRP
jgi:hypothetical protein